MRIHFISIGGSVMHQLSIALKHKGYNVSGSDDEIFEPAYGNLKNEGLLPPQFGWFPDNISTDTDVVILGMHAKHDNPELQKALQLGLKVYSFPEYIYQQSIDKKRVAIAGSHGKTTTTAMVMHVLKSAAIDFDFLVGAKLSGFSKSVQITDAPVIVFEADEYPASTIEKRPKFHFLFPHIAVLTGIAWDHINVFPTFDFYLEQFEIFISKIVTGGCLIYNKTDNVLVDLIKKTKRSDIRYIPYNVPEHRIEEGATTVKIGQENIRLMVFGIHNLLNLQAAYSVCKELGVDDATVGKSIENFHGASKRLELIASERSRNVYRDFAHAPSKVTASINAVKSQFAGRKLVAVLELHTFSSLNGEFMKEYKSSMDQADEAIVFYSNHALELKRMKPLHADTVAEGFGKRGLKVINDKKALEELLGNEPVENINILLMSSGNFEAMDIFKTLHIQQKK